MGLVVGSKIQVSCLVSDTLHSYSEVEMVKKLTPVIRPDISLSIYLV
jgi:hypothetical protein